MKRIKQHLKYIGLSTDTKPTNIPAGTLIKETDTNNMYEFDGENWNLISKTYRLSDWSSQYETNS